MVFSLEHLEQALHRAPVMGVFHPLLPLCLSGDVDIVEEAELAAQEVDDLAPSQVRPVLITKYEARYANRFITLHVPEQPSAELINQALPGNLRAARQLLTHRTVANRIVEDTLAKGYQTVILLLVDGLSYDDVRGWPERPEPCFIDGPSITYSLLDDRTLDLQVGFPAIVGTPSLGRRLADIGIPHSRGYSYWDREQNKVSATLFNGMPLTRVRGVSEALQAISTLRLAGLYVQVVREGLDGLAHRRREVTSSEIQATIQAIHQDFRQLVRLVVERSVKGAVYLIADHGILWKRQHPLERCVGTEVQANHVRYSTKLIPDRRWASPFETERQRYFLFHFPYLGTKIRANDSGVHGGLSYWESIVPFIRVEVNP